MAMLAGAAPTTLSEYMSSGTVRPTAIVQPCVGPSPNWSDLNQTAIDQHRSQLAAIESTLQTWFSDPAALSGEDFDAPLPRTIGRALEFVRLMKSVVVIGRGQRAEDLLRPLGVTVGTGGSISLEFGRGQYATTVVLEPDGKAEMMTFLNNRLVSRELVPV